MDTMNPFRVCFNATCGLAIASLLSACGAGTPHPLSSYTITGTAAYGHPIANQIVQITDSAGQVCAQGTTGTDGSYSLDTSSCASGSAAVTVANYQTPTGATLIAVAVPPSGTTIVNGVVNIDPLTTLIAYDAVGMVASASAPTSTAQVLALLSRVSSQQYSQAHADVITPTLLTLLQNSYGVSSNSFSANATSFAANGEGLDAFFDAYTLTAPTSSSVKLAIASGPGLSISVALPTTANTAASTASGSSVTSNVSFAVGGTVSGLSAGNVTLMLNGATSLIVPANGAFTFPTPVSSAYTVTVGTQPDAQTCSVSQGTGTITTANVTNVAITCAANSYTVSANVVGLASGGQLVLENNGGATTVTRNGSITLGGSIAAAGSYNVTVTSAPIGQVCTVSNGSGSGVTANVSTVSVTCTTNSYTVGGTVAGLSGSLVLQNNGTDSSTLTTNGSFHFLTPVAYGANYAVTVTTEPTNQTCTVVNANGTATADVSDVAVSCITKTNNPLYVYEPDYGANTIRGFIIDTIAGTRADIPGSPFAAGTSPQWVAADPSAAYLYVTNLGGDTLSVYSINHGTGALTEIAGSPYATGHQPASATVNPAGTLVFVANSQSATVSVFSINRSSGALTAVSGSPFATGSIPTKIAINPAGTFAFVANQNGDSISVYSINQTTGSLTPVAGSPFSTGYQLYGIAVDPSGTHVYSVNGQQNISGFTIDPSTGVLTAIAGSPFAMSYVQDGAGLGISFNASGTLAFVSTGQDGPLNTYSVDGTTGALTAISGASYRVGGGGSVYSTLDPSGTLLFTADFINLYIGVTTIDQTTGVLTNVPGSPFSSGIRPFDLVIVKP